MRLKIRALAFALALLGAGFTLLVGAVNLFYPNYGSPILEMLTSVFPGYSGTSTVKSVLTASGYVAFTGAVVGILIGLLYNLLADR